MISPGKRWFLYRAVSAGGVMPGRLSWGSLGHTRNWHCQLKAKSCTSVQSREDYAWFCTVTNPCIFTAHTRSPVLKGKASDHDFQYVDHAIRGSTTDASRRKEKNMIKQDAWCDGSASEACSVTTTARRPEA